MPLALVKRSPNVTGDAAFGRNSGAPGMRRVGARAPHVSWKSLRNKLGRLRIHGHRKGKMKCPRRSNLAASVGAESTVAEKTNARCVPDPYSTAYPCVQVLSFNFQFIPKVWHWLDRVLPCVIKIGEYKSNAKVTYNLNLY